MFTSTSVILISMLGLAAAAPTPSPESGSGSGSKSLVARGEFSGTATYYYQGGNPGSCGDYHSDNDFIVAVNAPQQPGSCGKQVQITNTKNGKTTTALAADTCPGCEWGSLDMSEGLFSYLGEGDMGQGVFPIEWDWTSSEEESD